MLFFLSCQHREVYSHFYELKGGDWSSTDTLVFDIDSSVLKLNVPYDVSIELMNNTEYPYQNIWLYIQDNLEGSQLQPSERQYELADQSGKWFGAGFGSVYQLSLIYKKRFIPVKEQDYTIKIVHGMRDKPLTGIEKVGLKIEPLLEK